MNREFSTFVLRTLRANKNFEQLSVYSTGRVFHSTQDIRTSKLK